jgi:beta-xylosidase
MSAMPATFANPVHPDYLADPFCFRHGDWYYAVATGKAEGFSPSFEQPRVVPMVRSRDLQNWESVGRVLALPEEPFTCFWAPEITEHEGRFYLYYHPCRAEKGGYHIRVAVADHPEGPYRDTGTPITDPDINPFAIDSHVFRDDDGQYYMFYATDFLDFNETTFRGTALVVDRMTSMTELAGNPQVVMRAHWPWQRYEANQKSHGVVADWYTLEGPTVCKRNGRYYCFYSGGCYQNDSYGVDWLEADTVLGPWREIGRENGPQLMCSVPGKVIGPGHHSMVTSPDGTDYVVYHAWNEEMTDRQMCVDRLAWEGGVPSVARFAPTIASKNAACTAGS